MIFYFLGLFSLRDLLPLGAIRDLLLFGSFRFLGTFGFFSYCRQLGLKGLQSCFKVLTENDSFMNRIVIEFLLFLAIFLEGYTIKNFTLEV